MEEIDQPQLNSQIPTQTYQTPTSPPEQSSNRWLIKYLLIGILGLIPVRIITTIVASFILPLLLVIGSLNVAPDFMFVIIYGFNPIILATFLVLVIFTGYYRHSTPDTKPSMIELLIVGLGGILGIWVAKSAYLYMLYAPLSSSEVPKITLPIYEASMAKFMAGLIVFLSFSFGSYLMIKLFHVITRKTKFTDLLTRPLVYLAIAFLLLVVIYPAGPSQAYQWFISSIQKKVDSTYQPLIDEAVKKVLLTPAPLNTTCLYDSDCASGLVCVGRGPTQPSKEIPGVCVSSKGSQAVQ